MRARRVAALYDVHANVTALGAVLSEIERERVDLVVFGGDVASGPQPKETVDRLRGLGENALFVRGNADREVVARASPEVPANDPIEEADAWCGRQLNRDDLAWLEGMRESLHVGIGSLGEVLFCHGSPRSDEESLTAATPPGRLHAALIGVDESVVVCGHTHMQFDCSSDGKRVVNAGSVGLPYEGRPGAYWALLGEDVELRRTEYDLDATVRAFRASGCPHVEEIFVEPLLNPPDPTEVAAQFEARAVDGSF